MPPPPPQRPQQEAAAARVACTSCRGMCRILAKFCRLSSISGRYGDPGLAAEPGTGERQAAQPRRRQGAPTACLRGGVDVQPLSLFSARSSRWYGRSIVGHWERRQAAGQLGSLTQPLMHHSGSGPGLGAPCGSACHASCK